MRPLLFCCSVVFVVMLLGLYWIGRRLHSRAAREFSRHGAVFMPAQSQSRPESLPPTLPALVGAILKADLNHNGQIDDDEMAAVRRPRMFVQYINQIIIACGDGDGPLPFSRDASEPLEKTQASLMSWRGIRQFENRDSNQKGHWSRWDWLNHTGMVNWSSRLPPESIAWHFFEPGLSPVQFPDTIAGRADQNHNGAIDPAESLEAERLARQDYDLDGYNRLDLMERRDLVAEAFVEDGLFRLCQEADRNGNGWLDPDEKPLALAAVLPLYDVDHNGRLDEGELWLVARDGRFSGNPASSGKPAPVDLAKLFAARRLADEAELQSRRQPVMDWLRLQLEEQMNPLLDAAGKKAIWEKLVAAYDGDHNGLLDQVEACRLYRQVAIREMPISNPPPSWWLTVVPLTEGIPGRDWRPVEPGLFKLTDADGDGLFSRSDRLSLRSCLRDKAKGRDLGQCLYVFWPIADKSADGRLDAEERTAALALARERFDANADGRLDEAEIARLLEAGNARLRENAIDNWLLKVGRGADCNGNGLLDAAEEKLARAVMMLAIDENNSGVLETWEIDKLILDTGCQDYWDGQNARVAEQLRRYDYDGDGRLNAEERRRADMDLSCQGRRGIVATPQEE
jgi:Ca2+-binding EF-hand superfamily protein